MFVAKYINIKQIFNLPGIDKDDIMRSYNLINTKSVRTENL